MFRSDRNHMALFLALLAGFIAGTWFLMVLRFERGDVYPKYSSLRSDPLGTRAFFDSLAGLEGIRVSRHMRPLKELKTGGEATLFILGVPLHPANMILREEAEALDVFLRAGGRVVLTLLPEFSRSNKSGGPGGSDAKEPDPDPGSPNTDHSSPDDIRNDPAESENDTPDKDQPVDSSDASQPEYTTLDRQWGISTVSVQRKNSNGDTINEYAIARRGGLPRTISWHSDIRVNDLSPAWKVLFSVADEPVMVERSVGPGSLVLATDSYLLSNEAMKAERLPGLLLYLTGRHSDIIIDETHHGLRQRHGLIGYIRAHRLHWILMVLFAVAGLFVWKNAVPLVPPDDRTPDADQPATNQARNAARGLTNLLRRNIAPKQLLKICFEQWEGAFTNNVRFPTARRDRARQVIEQPGSGSGKGPDPVSGYRAISRILSEDQPNE